MDLNNTCILANSAEKAKKIIEFYKKNGIFTAFFSDNEYPPISGRPDHIYYGVSYNQLYVACKQDIDERLHWKIIELPEETTSCMVHIIKNSEGKPIGWEMCPQTEEEHETVAIIRDLQFFGLDETYPSYNGLELIDPDKGKCTGNIKRISWLMRKYQNK